VFEDMNTRIPMILDAGTVGIGIESTILDMTADTPVILRPGYISGNELSQIVGEVDTDPTILSRVKAEGIRPKAPGMKYRHYAPKGQLILFEGEIDKVASRIEALVREKHDQGFKVGIIATDESVALYKDCPADYIKSIGTRKEPDSIAASLYGVLRDCDLRGLDYIYSESFFEEGIGDAIMNRLLKAAAYHLIQV
jgi:L-threonylcarbamoyladenylate synthase